MPSRRLASRAQPARGAKAAHPGTRTHQLESASRLLVLCASWVVLVLAFPAPSLAQAPPPPERWEQGAPPPGASVTVQPADLQEARVRTGLRAGAGIGSLSRPSDADSEEAFLFGAGFSGPALRLASSFSVPVGPWLRARNEIGIGWTRFSGSASVEDRSREITFKLTTLDIVLGPEAWTRLGSSRMEAFGGFHLGPRFGVRAAATDRRIGFETGEDLLRLRLSSALLLGAETGIAWHAPSGHRVPISVRWTQNLTHPSSSAGRSQESEDPDLGPRYLVETNWSVTGVIGVDF